MHKRYQGGNLFKYKFSTTSLGLQDTPVSKNDLGI